MSKRTDLLVTGIVYAICAIGCIGSALYQKGRSDELASQKTALKTRANGVMDKVDEILDGLETKTADNVTTLRPAAST